MRLRASLPTTLSLGSLLILFLILRNTFAEESKFARLDRRYYRAKTSKTDRRLLQSGRYSDTSDESSQSRDYSDENLWVGRSDFEGLFEEERAIGDHHVATSDEEKPGVFHGELEQKDDMDSIAVNYYEDIREEGLTHEDFSLENRKSVSKSRESIFDKQHEDSLSSDDDDYSGMKHKATDADAIKNGKMVALPSFEDTPMPKKMSFSQWIEQDKQKKIRKRGHTVELTSSLYLVPEAKSSRENSYVASCLVVRDDHDSIIEWIKHHLSLGIGRIYVYDHLSIPPLDSLLSSFIANGLVLYERLTLQSSKTELSPQLYAYNKCLTDYGHNHRWLAFLDVDEFIMFRDGHPIQSLPAFLTGYEAFSSLAIHWILFGSSEYDTKPSKSVLRSYTRCIPLKHAQHLFVKSIVNTGCTIGTADSPHSFKHNCSAPAVRTDMSSIVGATSSVLPVHDKLVIHHYATKSVEDFELKILRGSGMRRQRGWDYFFFVDGWSSEFNFDGLRVWNSDVMSKSRALDPEMLALQIEGYSKEVLEDFWGNSQATKEDVLDYLEQYDDYKFQTKDQVESVDDDAEEGEW